MLLRTHGVFGIFAGLFLFSLAGNWFLFFLALLFGVLIVDIDTKNSKIGRKWFFRPLQLFVSHRGIFHTLVFCIFLSGLIFFVNYSIGIGFFVGYSSHLILDCFTCSGLMLFWPFSKKKIKFWIKSGGLIEEVLFVLFLLLDVFLILKIVLGLL